MSEIIAYHEAGHALLAVLLGGAVRLATIEPYRDDGPVRQGDTQIIWRRMPGDDREYAKTGVHVCLAGPVAEMIYSGEPYHPGFVAEWADDWKTAWDLAGALHVDERKRLNYLEEVTARLYRQLEQENVWAALAAIADNLLAHETLEGEQIEEIVRDWLG